MPNITKIHISSASGYVLPEYVYHDSLIITKDSIRYSNNPAEESEVNRRCEWTYTTNSPVYAQLFEELTKTIPGVMAIDPGRGMFDVGTVSFLVIYDDGTAEEETWYLPKFMFEECFTAAQKMIPQFEEMPRVLRIR